MITIKIQELKYNFEYRNLEMKSFILKIVLVLCFNFLFTTFIFAIPAHPSAGTTSAGFLKIPVGARGTSLAGYYAGVDDEISLLYWNPAGLANIVSSQIGLSHREHFQGIKQDFFGYVFRNKDNVFGLSLISFYAGGIEGRSGINDMNEQWVNLYQVTLPDYYFSVLDLAVCGSYIRNIGKNIFLGTNLKFILQTIDNYSGYSVGLDFGLNYLLIKNLRLGFVIKNFGLPIKLDKESYPLPLELGFGGIYRYKKTSFMLNFNQPVDNYLTISTGVENEILKYLKLRAGYRYKIFGWLVGVDAGLSGGLGINFFGTRLDYAISSYSDLGVVHTISLSLDLDRVNNFYKKFREKFAIYSVIEKTEEVKPEKTEVLKPIALNPVNENMFKQLETNRYNIKTQINKIFYDIKNKIYTYEFTTMESLELYSQENKKLVLKKLVGKFSSRNKYEKNLENNYEIITSKVFDVEEKLFLDKQKVIQTINLSNYFNNNVYGITLYFLQQNYSNLNFYVIDKNLQKLNYVLVQDSDDKVSEIFIPKNLKIFVVEE